MAERYEDQYRRDRGYRRDDRGFMDRAGDELRSWFGDDEAERRRQMDNRERDMYRDREYGRQGAEGGSHGWGDRGYGDRNDRPSGYGDRGYSSGDRGYSTGDRGYSDRGYGYGGDRSGFGDRSSSSSYGYGDRSSGYGDRSYGSGDRSSYGSGYGSGYGGGSSYGSGYGSTGSYGSTGGYGSSSGSYGSSSGSQGGEDRNRGGQGWFTGRGPKGYQRSDDRINEDVCDRLCDSHEIDASNVEVKVSNGEVTLTGSVQDRNQKRRAEDIIEQVSGVREVHNNLRVSQDTGMGSASMSGTTGASTGASTGSTMGASAGASNTGTASTTAEQPGNVLGVTGGAPDKASSAGRR